MKAFWISFSASVKRHRWRYIFSALSVILVVALTSGFLFYNSKIDRMNYTNTDTPEEQEDIDTVDEEGIPVGFRAKGDVINILLLGTDDSGETFSDEARADSIMIASLDVGDGTLKLVSLERGIAVPIEGQEDDWLTHVFAYTGAKGMLETVSNQFMVPVNRYVRVNFNSFEDIIDAIGGVDITFTKEEYEALQLLTPTKLKEGVNHLNGSDALQYARLRSIDDDFHRVARQRTVIQAAIDELSSSSIFELNNIANVVLENLETNMTKKEINYLVGQIPQFIGVTADQLTLPEEENILPGYYASDGRILTSIDFAQTNRELYHFLYGEWKPLDELEPEPSKYKPNYTQPDISSQGESEEQSNGFMIPDDGNEESSGSSTSSESSRKSSTSASSSSKSTRDSSASSKTSSSTSSKSSSSGSSSSSSGSSSSSSSQTTLVPNQDSSSSKSSSTSGGFALVE